MNQSIALISLVVQDYDEAIKFYVGKLGFVRVEDTNVPPQSKRWVVVAPPGLGNLVSCLQRHQILSSDDASAPKPEAESFCSFTEALVTG